MLLACVCVWGGGRSPPPHTGTIPPRMQKTFGVFFAKREQTTQQGRAMEALCTDDCNQTQTCLSCNRVVGQRTRRQFGSLLSGSVLVVSLSFADRIFRNFRKLSDFTYHSKKMRIFFSFSGGLRHPILSTT